VLEEDVILYLGLSNVMSYLIDQATRIFQGRDKVGDPLVWVFAEL
jgi:hypothetical protein